MMFNKNTEIEFNENGDYKFHFDESELIPILDKLLNRENGVVNVKISKAEIPGTEAQNRLFHSLMQEYYKTGMSSCPDKMTLDAFKVYLKLLYGPCYEMTVKGQLVRVPKSWANYTKLERAEMIGHVINEVIQSGAMTESKKLHEIITELENNRMTGGHG